jgi:hypothetical protein
MTELKPCPFCGSDPDVSWPKAGDYADDPECQCSISCTSPKCMVSHVAMPEATWNTRAPAAPSPSDAALSALRPEGDEGWEKVATMLLESRYGVYWTEIIEVHGADYYAVKLAQRLSSPAAPKSPDDGGV